MTSVLSNYLSSCLALESLSDLPKPSGAQDLTLELDHVIDFLRNTTPGQLAQSCSSLARTRNRLVTNIYSLPPELLSEIFRLVIYAPGGARVRPLKAGVKILYRRLHTLIGVCSVWRKVGLGQSELWSIIPLIDNGQGHLSDATRLSLQRSGNSKLYVAADLGYSMPKSMDAMSGGAARFHTLNIRSECSDVIANLISLWLVYGVPGSVTDLSICYHNSPHNPNPRESAHSADVFSVIRLRGPRMCRLLSRFMAPLSTLRISGVLPHLSSITYKGLMELRISNVEFDTYDGYRAFLRSLSSISSLLSLGIDSVSTRRSWGGDPNLHKSINSPTNLPPSLQTLYLGDLSPYLLEITFWTIAPGSYRLVLYLGKGSFPYELSTHDEDVNIGTLLAVLRGRDVSVLLLDRTLAPAITKLLQSLLTLRSLFLDFLDFDRIDAMEMLLPPPGPNIQFPVLRELNVAYFALSAGSPPEKFKKFLSSHAIESITLGGDPHGFEPENSQGGWRPLYPSDKIATWLRSTVPNFRLIDHEDGIQEFNFWRGWQLW